MKRREFIAGIGGVATSYLWPGTARAQQPQKQRAAFVHSGILADQLTETAGPFWVRRFYETLRGLGHTEGVNLVVERYSAEGRSERFAALAAAVVSSKPDVIVSNHNDLVKAFAAATATVPIVAITGDPIAEKLVTNAARRQPYRRQQQGGKRNPWQAPANPERGDTVGEQGRLLAVGAGGQQRGTGVSRSSAATWYHADCEFSPLRGRSTNPPLLRRSDATASRCCHR